MGVPDVNGDVSVVRAESLLPLQLQVGPQDFDLAAARDANAELLRGHLLLECLRGLFDEAAPPDFHVAVLAADRPGVRRDPCWSRLLDERCAEAGVELPAQPLGKAAVKVQFPEPAGVGEGLPGQCAVVEVPPEQRLDVVRLHPAHRHPFQWVEVLDHRSVDLLIQLDRGAGRAVVQRRAIAPAGNELAPHLLQDVCVAGVGLPQALDDPEALANPAELDELHAVLDALLDGVSSQDPSLAGLFRTLLAPLAENCPEVAPKEGRQSPADDGVAALPLPVDAQEELGLPQVPPRRRRHPGSAGSAGIGGLRGLRQLPVDPRRDHGPRLEEPGRNPGRREEGVGGELVDVEAVDAEQTVLTAVPCGGVWRGHGPP